MQNQGARGPLVVLIGPPGAGKSAVGPLLANLLGVKFRDTDADAATAAGKPVGDIFVEDGEETFRELERAAVTSALGEQGAEPARGVLALGSGAVLDEGVRQLLAGQPVVYLSTSFGTVVRRIGLDRPRVVVPGNPRGRLRARGLPQMRARPRPKYGMHEARVGRGDYDMGVGSQAGASC